MMVYTLDLGQNDNLNQSIMAERFKKRETFVLVKNDNST